MTMKTLETFIKNHNLSLRLSREGLRSDGMMSDMPKGSSHWRCMVGSPNGHEEFWFSMGPAHKDPTTLENLLACLQMDCRDVDLPFEQWAEDLGYNTDSRSAEKIYLECAKVRAQLIRLLGRKGFAEFQELDLSDY
jgi:hypothetical protein